MADPSHFSDPFWTPPQDDLYTLPQSDKASYGVPASWSSLDRTVGVELKVGGLGTISAKAELPEKSLMFIVHSENPNKQPTLMLEVTKDDCILKKRETDSDEYKPIPELVDLNPQVKDRAEYTDKVMFPKGKKSALLDATSSDKTTYWISVDRSNARIRYGKYLTNNSMTFMEVLFDKDNAKWMKHLNSTDVYRDDDPVPSNNIRFNEAPVTTDFPPLVVSQDQITLKQIEEFSAMTFANLPEGCQKLYHNISGPGITVQSADFPQLPEAIDLSCRDENKLCGKILKDKVKEFGGKEETYLRITVGDNLANSPGIPYVMEIWPPGHYSPIHQHGDASAIIRVLYGSIDVTWFDALEKKRTPKPINNPVRLSKGDITWLGENQYQIHQLKNNTDKVCITLQCYQFEKNDTIHDEAFHWIDKDLEIKDFVPNSDRAYGTFVREMKEEWEKENSKLPN